jgi:hypothetical protein
MPAGSTVEVEKAPEGDEQVVKITIAKPARKREKVGVGAEGGELADETGEGPAEAADLPDEPDVLPDVPDAPPAPEGDGEPDAR